MRWLDQFHCLLSFLDGGALYRALITMQMTILAEQSLGKLCPVKAATSLELFL
jgi:hypothetical protein